MMVVVNIIHGSDCMSSMLYLQHGMDLMFVVKKNSPEQCEEALMRYKDK